jgi:hypothetical protein
MTHDRPTLTCLSSRRGEFDKSLERVTVQRPRTTETRRINGNDSTRERTGDDREVSTGRTQAWPQQNRRPGRITPLANRQTADQPLVHDCSLSACCSSVRAPDRSVARRILPPKSPRPLPVPMHRGSAVPRIGAHQPGGQRKQPRPFRWGRLVDPLHRSRTERCFKLRRQGSVTLAHRTEPGEAGAATAAPVLQLALCPRHAAPLRVDTGVEPRPAHAAQASARRCRAGS